jgi:hypothetical protein
LARECPGGVGIKVVKADALYSQVRADALGPAIFVPGRELGHPWLHIRLIALLGFVVGEMFDLEALATDCADDGVYEGIVHCRHAGDSGSPADGLAIK